MNLVLVLTVLSALARNVSGADYEVFVVTPAINNEAILPGSPLPAVCRAGTVMKIMACRGEYEPASFVVKANGPLSGVRVDVERLTGPAGTLASDAVDIRVVQVLFRRVTDWPAHSPALLLHDPDLIVVDEKPQPIALADDAHPVDRAYTHTNRLTRHAVDTADLQPVDIEDTRQFWITVRVPDTCASGVYQARLTVRPENALPTNLTLDLTVHGFDLLPPPFEYSVYHPAYLDRSHAPTDPRSFVNVTPVQLLAELKNMVAHGCANPNIYFSRFDREDGSPDFETLTRLITIRDCAGISRDKPLYLVKDPPPGIQFEPLDDQERQQMIAFVRRVVDWARAEGVPDVYFMGADEASGARLRGERDSFKAIHEGGGKVFVACGNDSFDLVGDLLDLSIIVHPSHGRIDSVGHKDRGHLRGPEALRNPQELLKAGGAQTLLEPHLQKIIAGVHANGFRIFTYMDPIGGQTVPGLHRRNRGLGLWKSGLDGSMTWAYTHIVNNNLGVMSDPLEAKANQSLLMGLVFRAQDSVIDTPGWEGYREGVDDARYLATLWAALDAAQAKRKHGDLVEQTRHWLDQIGIDEDLDAMRREMAGRIEALQAPGE